MWLYEGRELTSDDLVGMAGFVYEVENLDDKKIYIGQKKATSTRKVNPTKKNGMLKPKRVTAESDWQSYWGSSDELKKLIAANGEDRFQRRVLRICKSKSEMNYYELREQMLRDVLLRPTEFYNRYAGTRINANHLRHLQQIIEG